MWIPLIAALACSGAPSTAPADPPPAPQDAPQAARGPDVVVIVVDTLRVDRLGLYGADEDTAPFLSALAAESAVLEHAWSTSSWTAPSTASVFTGLYPTQHGVTAGLVATKAMRQAGAEESDSTLAINQLPAGLLTLPELFRDQGYDTYGVTTNININDELGFTRGFDQFAFFSDGSARKVAETVVGWESGLRSETPYFLYLHLNDAHSPYLARDPWFVASEDPQASQLSAYDSEIHYLDLYIGRLYERLGWGDDTVLMIVSDHGEAFGEHGQTGHHFSLYRELNQVLWLTRAPGVAAGRHAVNASLVDVLPTALALAGGEVPADRAGVSLAPLLTGGEAGGLEERALYAHRWDAQKGDLWGIIQGGWRLLDWGERRELYDLVADPGELSDQSAAKVEVTAGLQEALGAFRADPGRTWTEVNDVALDPEQIEMLERLGYVGH